MLYLRFSPEDLLRCRFAVSPLWETHAALEALLAPGSHAALLPWLREAAPRIADLPLDPLRALLERSEGRHYVPDFLTPPPVSPLDDFATELARVRATRPEQVRAELSIALHGRRPTGARRSLLADPKRARDRIADLVEQVWARLLAEEWPRLRDLLDGDVLVRAQHLAAGGLELMLRDLDPGVSWRAGAIRVRSPFEQSRDLDGSGLLFVPSAFSPTPRVILDPPWQPTLIYPARGSARFVTRPRAATGALADLLGRSRAALLAELAVPSGTTALADRLELAPGTVSEHLAVLRDAGLATAQRTGRQVRYSLTPLGHALLTAPVNGPGAGKN